MWNRKIEAYPLCAWLFCAMSAPLAMVSAGYGYLTALPLLLGCGLLTWSIYVLSEGGCYSAKWYSVLQLLWLTAALTAALFWSKKCWQVESDFNSVPLVLLILAASSVWNGAERGARVNGTVFWLLALLYAVSLAAGVGGMKLRWLAPELKAPDPKLIFVYLIPVVITFLPRVGGKCYTPTLLLTGVFALVLSVWTVGTLSPQAAEKLPFPFYEYSKSMRLFGVGERLEAVASVALTVGMFSLLSLLCGAVGRMTENLFPGKGRVGIGVLSAAALAGVYGNLEIPGLFLGAGALLFWGILPLIAHCWGKKEKSKNNEKST